MWNSEAHHWLYLTAQDMSNILIKQKYYLPMEFKQIYTCTVHGKLCQDCTSYRSLYAMLHAHIFFNLFIVLRSYSVVVYCNCVIKLFKFNSSLLILGIF